MKQTAERVVFDADTHTYWLGGRRIPNVTTVIDAFAQQYAGIPEWILAPARERGTAVHKATEYDDLGTLDEDALDDSLRPYLDAWRRFRREAGFAPELTEERVFSSRYFYAGMLDRVGRMRYWRRPDRILLDIKSGSALRTTTGMQTAAYAEALPGKPLPRFGVELHDDGTYRLEQFTDTNDLPDYLAALRLWNWRQKHG